MTLIIAAVIIAAVIGCVGIAVGGIWIVVIAFRESTQCGLLSSLVPFYELYYVITRWAKAKRPFFIGLIGVGFLVVGIVPALMQYNAEAKPVVAEFMEVAAVRDIDTACTLFASPVSETGRKNLEELILGSYELFEDYQGIKTRHIEFQWSKSGDTIVYSGEVQYLGGFKGWVDAELIKQGEEWKLISIWVEISEEKWLDYKKRH